MKAIIFSAILALSIVSGKVAHAAGPFIGERFQKVIYFSGAAGAGSVSGLSASNAKAIADDTLVWAIPAGTVIENVYVIIDTALSGTTQIDIGDDDDANGYVDGSIGVTEAATGMYNASTRLAGAYLRDAAGSGGTDTYVVPAQKYYSASGKEIRLDATGTCTGGAFRLVIQGYRVGA